MKKPVPELRMCRRADGKRRTRTFPLGRFARGVPRLVTGKKADYAFLAAIARVAVQ
uniref:Uncharacterized protein n=1 Tax=mine drainage metagenome TaxID=410659 RepID=E6QC96_9ZZZZ